MQLANDTDKPKFVIPKEHYLTWRWLNVLGAKPLPETVSNGPRRYPVFLGRNAIVHGLRALGLQRGDRVLVPAYICSVVPESIIAYGAEVDFYDVLPNCGINVARCEDRIGPRTRAVVVVHYFGFPTPLKGLKDLCRRHGIYLIEDCAHVLSSEADGNVLGTTGDMAIFSLRKFLPIYDGGLLCLNNTKLACPPELDRESLLFTLKVAKNILDVAVSSATFPILKWLPGLMQEVKALLCKVKHMPHSEAQHSTANVNAAVFDVRSLKLPMSRVSKWIAYHSAVKQIIAARRRNYLDLLAGLKQLDAFHPICSELPPTVCPLVLATRVDGVREAQREFRRRGIPASHWGGVRFPTITQQMYSCADELYEKLIFLPIHQNLAPKDIAMIVKIAGAVVRD